MIAAIKQKLLDMDKLGCVNTTLFGQEKGKGVKLTPSARGEALKIKVDGCLIKNDLRCDCLYFYQTANSKRYIFLVELKGNNYAKALTQLAATKSHPNYTALHEAAKPCAATAVAIVAKRGNVNRPKKDEWEVQNHVRLHVERLDDDETYDLINLVKKTE